MSKYYAVRVGKRPGIYTNWPECQAQIKGFSKAIFKSFTSRAEALNFLHDGQVPECEKNKPTTLLGLAHHPQGNFTNGPNDNNAILGPVQAPPARVLGANNNYLTKYPGGELVLPTWPNKDYLNADRNLLNTPDQLCVIYVDGSKRPSVKHRGSGVYCRFNFQDYWMSQPLSKEVANRYDIKESDYDGLSSPTMEYLAFSEVLYRFTQLKVKCVEQSITMPVINSEGQTLMQNQSSWVPQKLDPPLYLYFVSDYLGVKCFSDGSWQPKEDYIIKIRATCALIIKWLAERGVYVYVHHVNGHVGVLGNELCDIMAKSQNFFDTIPTLVNNISVKFM